jgi:GT2 family glycosyltransferase/glycosyltransferase involved in cell wall biosynthesis
VSIKRREAAVRAPIGVNIAGFLSSEKGVGEAVRSTVRILDAEGIPYVLNNVRDPGSVNKDTSTSGFAIANPHAVNLVHVNPDALPYFLSQRGQHYFKNHYNIAYWPWELDTFPVEWRSAFRHFHEIWVPSTFAVKSISSAAPIPVIKVPYSLSEEISVGEMSRAAFGIAHDAFVFLFIFDFHSYAERKNPLATIEAFKKAFGKRRDVQLVLKCSRPEFDPVAFRRIKQAARGSNVIILEQVLARAEINALLNHADCYVSLHRSEGYGLTIAEAMRFGKPVIATNYSGNVDFMTSRNSLPVKYDLIENKRDHGPYKKGCRWAEPCTTHAAELMSCVRDNPERARAVGGQARRDIGKMLAPSTIGKLVRARLGTIANGGLLDGLPGMGVPQSVYAQRPRCSIVVPVFNRSSLTRQLLRILLDRRPLSNTEIIVVDDASTDDTPRLLAKRGDRIRVVTHPTNQGFATSCNDGAAVATGSHLLFLNNDTIPCDDWLDSLLNYAESHRKAGIVGAKLLFPNDTIQHAGVVICQDRLPRHIYSGFPGNHPAVNQSRPFPAVTGACLLIGRRLFDDLRGFDDCFRNCFEDMDLCFRARELGYECHYHHESVLYHLESATRLCNSDEERRAQALFLDRWADRLEPDDLTYYARDGLLRINYEATYPIPFSMSPFLGVPQRNDGEWTTERLLQDRTRQIRSLLKDNVRLKVKARGTPPGDRSAEQENRLPPSKYQTLVESIRRTARTVLPTKAKVLVVSKGDSELLRIRGLRTGHFPQTQDGIYAGHHPTDSASAIAHLQVLRRCGNHYLLFPNTAFWWFAYYSEFLEHIQAHGRRVHKDADCIIFEMDPVARKRRHRVTTATK